MKKSLRPQQYRLKLVLECVREGKVTLDAEALTDRFTMMGEDDVVQDTATWAGMAGYVERQERVQITYQEFSGEVVRHAMGLSSAWTFATVGMLCFR